MLIPEAIDIHLLATSKEGVLKELCKLLFNTKLVKDEEVVLQAVMAREQAGSTGCGCGVAVPHARLAGVERCALALGISKTGVEFGAVDGTPVKIFFFIVGPQKAPETYLRLLSQIAQLIKEEEFRAALLDCASPSEVIELFRAV